MFILSTIAKIVMFVSAVFPVASLITGNAIYFAVAAGGLLISLCIILFLHHLSRPSKGIKKERSK